MVYTVCTSIVKSNLTDKTHQTKPCPPLRHAIPKRWSCSDGGCVPSSLVPVGLHSCCCHQQKNPKHGLKVELHISSHWFQQERRPCDPNSLTQLLWRHPSFVIAQFKLEVGHPPCSPLGCFPCLLLIILLSFLGGR